MDCDPAPTRFVMRCKNGRSFDEVSPFRIADEIRAVIGEVEAARLASCGGLLVTASLPERGYKILCIWNVF